jgi:hypothetical protein
MDNKEQFDKLRAFVLDTSWQDDLRKFEEGVNVFRVLGLERYEIRHSNMLAWLFNPKENHGLRDGFLRMFLEKLCEFDNLPLKEYISMDYSDAIVIREKKDNIETVKRNKVQSRHKTCIKA